VRPAVAEQVGRDDRVVVGELRDQLTPGVRAVADAVDEQQRRTLTGVDECPPIAVDGPVLHLVIHWGRSPGFASLRQVVHASNLHSRLRVPWATKLSPAPMPYLEPSRAE